MRYISLYMLPLILFSFSVFAQKNSHKLTQEETQEFNEAENYFAEENYSRALSIYEEIITSYPSISYYKLKAGICHIYIAEEKQKAVKYLEEVLKESPETQDIYFFLGKAYHLNEQFDLAILYLKKYLDKKPSEKKREEVETLLKNCEDAKVLIQDTVIVKITNVGSSINTKNFEYVPVISSDESVLIYTYKGERSKGGLLDYDGLPSPFGDYYEDVFISYRVGDNWLFPESIGDNINTKGHDACIALSADGQKLFVFKSTIQDGGDIYMSILDGDIWTTPAKLSGEVNSKYWEGSASLSSDGNTLYFSSERPGGYGGRDIYKADIQLDGSWGNVANLGSTINTKSDDDAPFIHPDGKMFFYSSKGHKNIGGYDIFISEHQEDGTWSTPVNMGYPVNTTKDDIYYVVSGDGKRGYYSSNQPGGFGKQDIYMIEPAITNKVVALVMIKGLLKLNEAPVKADIKVSNADNNLLIGNYSSNTATGKYLIHLPNGSDYKLLFKINGAEDQERIIKTSKTDSFINATMDLDFYTKDFLEKQKTKAQSQNTNGAHEQPVEEMSYEQLVQKYGQYSTQHLTFRVQIGAYENEKKVNFNSLSSIGNVEKQKYQDGITRFTLGGDFKTLKQADQILKRIKAKGIEDAFVLCFYRGIRTSLKNVFSTVRDK